MTIQNSDRFAFTIAHPGQSPTDIDISSNLALSKLQKDQLKANLSSELPTYLRDKFTRYFLIALCYLTVIPAIILAVRANSLQNRLATETATLRLTDSARELPHPQAGGLDPSIQAAPVIRAVPAEANPAETEPLAWLNTLTRNSFSAANQRTTLDNIANLTTFLKETNTRLNRRQLQKLYNCRRNLIQSLQSVGSTQSPQNFGRLLNKIKVLIEVLPAFATDLPFSSNLHSLIRENARTLTLSISEREDGRNQFNYSNTAHGITRGDARSSCGSCALAWLIDGHRAGFDPVDTGHQIHIKYRENGDYADFEENIIGGNNGVNTDGQMIFETGATNRPSMERFHEILLFLQPNTGGLLLVGPYFIAVKKHNDGRVSIYDSHGSGIGTGRDGQSPDYSATFENEEDAAIFLSAHRDSAGMPGALCFNGLAFRDGLSTQDLIHRATRRAPSPPIISRVLGIARDCLLRVFGIEVN